MWRAYFGMNLTINALLKPLVDLTMSDVQKKGEDYESVGKKEYEKYKNLIKIIREDFKRLIKVDDREEYQGKPVMIFFDDLDRCLPDKSIQLLEAVKNLFIIPETQVIFICGIDTHIAKQFIKAHYKGIEDTFAINYFRKIFNLTVSMPCNPNVYHLLLNYIKELYAWDDPQAQQLANMVHSRGIQAEIASVREYLNIIHNFYTSNTFFFF